MLLAFLCWVLIERANCGMVPEHVGDVETDGDFHCSVQ